MRLGSNRAKVEERGEVGKQCFGSGLKKQVVVWEGKGGQTEVDGILGMVINGGGGG